MKAPSPDKLALVKEYARPSIAFALAKIPGTEQFAIASSDFAVAVGEFAKDKFEAKDLYKHDSYATGIVATAKFVISGGYDGKLQWWSLEDKKPIRTVEAHKKWIRQLRLSPDGKLLLSIADDMTGRLWDAETGKAVRDLTGHKEKTPHHFPSMLYAAAFAPKGDTIATGDKTGRVILWETATGNIAGEVEAPGMYTWDPVQRLHSIGGIRSLAFSPDGKQLAVGGMGKVGNIDHLEGKARVEVFDVTTGKRAVEFPGDKFSGLVNRLCWAGDGSWLLGAGGSGEGFLLFFDVTTKKVLKQEKAAMHIHDAWLSDESDRLVCAGHNKLLAYKLG